MKKTWDNLGLSAHNFKQALEELLPTIPQSPAMMKRVRDIENKWKKFMRLYNQMDGFITPVKAVDIKPPWNNDKFLDAWQYWKDYLIEQHGVFMRSRSEVMALKQLKNITDNNPEKAIKYLEYAIAGRYKNFFEVKEEETNNTTENGQQKKTVFKLN